MPVLQQSKATLLLHRRCVLFIHAPYCLRWTSHSSRASSTEWHCENKRESLIEFDTIMSQRHAGRNHRTWGLHNWAEIGHVSGHIVTQEVEELWAWSEKNLKSPSAAPSLIPVTGPSCSFVRKRLPEEISYSKLEQEMFFHYKTLKWRATTPNPSLQIG